MERIAAAVVLSVLIVSSAEAAYKATTPAAVPPEAVAVTTAGNLDKAGTTYVLAADVKSPTGVFCLGKDVTLDLNGHTVEYASAAWEHVPNGGFETGGLEPWDVSKAPGAKVVETDKARPFVGKYLCVLPEGQEIVSPYINLPVPLRSYYAMCGVTDQNRAVSVSVEDEQGRPVVCKFRFGSRERDACPIQGSVKLGGGFVFALIYGQPAGKYRIRVKAVKGECQVDEIDIRPALDAGIAVVEKTYPWAYYRCIHDGDYTAFFDLNKPGTAGEPLDTVPKVEGAGTITIKNGVIRSGAVGVRSWGLQSTAKDVTIRLENVRFEAAGINTNAVDVPVADIRDCRFEISTPFIIDRHRIGDMSVRLSGPGASKVTDSEFLGGQGCLSLNGADTEVANCLFVNEQTVTNHYSIAAYTSGVRIHDNRFEPKIGSGVEIFRGSNCEVYSNVFKITAAPPNCEYRFSDYSTNAIRVTDYNAEAGSAKGCVNNRIRDNKFFITGRDYPQYDRYIPMAYGLFVSVGAGTTHVTNNEFTVDDQGGKQGICRAIYIGGSSNGGEYVGNRITTNVPAFWVASRYGEAGNVLIRNNTVVKAPDAKGKFAPFEFGWWKYAAKDVALKANVFEGLDFDVFLNTYAGDAKSTYSVWWTLTVKAAPGAEVVITDKDGKEALRKAADAKGTLAVELMEYRAAGQDRTYSAPYRVTVGGATQTVDLKKNTAVTF